VARRNREDFQVLRDGKMKRPETRRRPRSRRFAFHDESGEKHIRKEAERLTGLKINGWNVIPWRFG